MTTEILKLVAAFCMVAAGDKNDYQSVVSQVENSQVECHAFYSECLETKSIQFCMKRRKQKIKEDFDEYKRKLNGGK